ncbi:hypothetical protein AX14_012139 [Amanita brunnescens Koide BX004]|nr:hypothetical protein AX14_012139 [Amanita brunnescens Koide BX004]
MGCKTRIKRRSAFHAHLRRKHDITDVEMVKVLRQPLDPWRHASKKTSNPPPGDQFPILWSSLSPQAMLPYTTCSDYAPYNRTRQQSDMAMPSQTIDPRLLQLDMYRFYDESSLCVRDPFAARVGTLESSPYCTMRGSYGSSMDCSATWYR